MVKIAAFCFPSGCDAFSANVQQLPIIITPTADGSSIDHDEIKFSTTTITGEGPLKLSISCPFYRKLSTTQSASNQSAKATAIDRYHTMSNPAIQAQANALNAKLEGEASKVLDDLERNWMRKVARESFSCAVKCYDKAGNKGPSEGLEQCSRNCQIPYQQSNQLVQQVRFMYCLWIIQTIPSTLRLFRALLKRKEEKVFDRDTPTSIPIHELASPPNLMIFLSIHSL